MSSASRRAHKLVTQDRVRANVETISSSGAQKPLLHICNAQQPHHSVSHHMAVCLNKLCAFRVWNHDPHTCQHPARLAPASSLRQPVRSAAIDLSHVTLKSFTFFDESPDSVASVAHASTARFAQTNAHLCAWVADSSAAACKQASQTA
eukprot:m.237586 g.237586  ORF g.237586 m.237586 type:complete len:149 (+) comp10908_c0_seq5:345-791(+)